VAGTAAATAWTAVATSSTVLTITAKTAPTIGQAVVCTITAGITNAVTITSSLTKASLAATIASISQGDIDTIPLLVSASLQVAASFLATLVAVVALVI